MLLKSAAMQRVEWIQHRPLEQVLYDLYVIRGLTITQVCAELGVSRPSVIRWMRLYNIPRRARGNPYPHRQRNRDRKP